MSGLKRLIFDRTAEKSLSSGSMVSTVGTLPPFFSNWALNWRARPWP